jgi:hypothetical protein
MATVFISSSADSIFAAARDAPLVADDSLFSGTWFSLLVEVKVGVEVGVEVEVNAPRRAADGKSPLGLGLSTEMSVVSIGLSLGRNEPGSAPLSVSESVRRESGWAASSATRAKGLDMWGRRGLGATGALPLKRWGERPRSGPAEVGLA